MIANNEIADALVLLDNYIVEHKLRNTRERKEILACIYTIDGHFTAHSLYEQMDKHFQVSQATIYNTLELFVKLKLIVQHSFGNNGMEYERFTRNLSHYHRICTECGVVKEFTDIKVKKAVKNHNFNSFDTSYASLTVYGLCKKCQRKMKFKKK